MEHPRSEEEKIIKDIRIFFFWLKKELNDASVKDINSQKYKISLD